MKSRRSLVLAVLGVVCCAASGITVSDKAPGTEVMGGEDGGNGTAGGLQVITIKKKVYRHRACLSGK